MLETVDSMDAFLVPQPTDSDADAPSDAAEREEDSDATDRDEDSDAAEDAENGAATEHARGGPSAVITAPPTKNNEDNPAL